jgi:Protein of unknown function (DUF2842)
MKQRARKFAGIWLILGLLVVYPILATLIYTEGLDVFLAKANGTLANWITLAYFIIAGLGWAFPAGVIIKWMAKPDLEA